jgi:hypothetical protein
MTPLGDLRQRAPVRSVVPRASGLRHRTILQPADLGAFRPPVWQSLIRESFDLDLFVEPDDAPRLKELLKSAGFAPRTVRPRITPRQSAILARYVNEGQ